MIESQAESFCCEHFELWLCAKTIIFCSVYWNQDFPSTTVFCFHKSDWSWKLSAVSQYAQTHIMFDKLRALIWFVCWTGFVFWLWRARLAALETRNKCKMWWLDNASVAAKTMIVHRSRLTANFSNWLTTRRSWCSKYWNINILWDDEPKFHRL